MMTMFPIKCLVEALEEDQCPQCSKSATSVLVSDSYAIVNGQTRLSQLTDTVLAALGLQHLSPCSRATLQLKNWKPLPFDQITDDQEQEIETILKDVSNHLTLRIVTRAASSVVRDGIMSDLKDRLLRAILQKVPSMLSEQQQMQWKDFLSQLAFSDGACASLEPSSFVPPHAQQLASMYQSWCGSDDEWHCRVGIAAVEPIDLRAPADVHHESAAKVNGGGGASCDVAGRFNNLLEVPKLERWFRENANPSRQKLQHYLIALNSTNYRRHNPKVTYQQICNWFINARAAVRKRNQRSSMLVMNQKAADWSRHPKANLWSNKSLAPPQFHQKPSGVPCNELSPTSSSPRNDANVQQVDQSDSVPVDMNGPAPNISAFQLSGSCLGQNNVDTASSPSPQLQSPFEVDEKAAVVVAAAAASSCSSHASPNEPDLSLEHESRKLVIAETCHPHKDVSLEDGALQRYDTPQDEKMLNVCCPFVAVSPPSAHNDTSLSPTSGAKANGVQTNPSSSSSSRSRLMFDPLSELPMLEHWFDENPHPSWVQIDQITDALNCMAYRHTYPRVSSHNVKIWFKNRRAKCKRNLIASDALMNGL